MTTIHQQAIQHHYDNILRDSYSWMFGDFDAKVSQTERFFNELNLTPSLNRLAVDIGAGSGFQTIPLLRRGFAVHSVDVSAALLKELQSRVVSQSLFIHQQEATVFLSLFESSIELLVCMGDTLTHFASRAAVTEFFGRAHHKLLSGGQMILSFRNYANAKNGHSEIISVRTEAERSLSCILDYYQEYLRVTDVIREYEGGEWKTRRGIYHKLRLSPQWVEAELKQIGFKAAQVATKDDFILVSAQKN
jgi:2-polyprenyl-3-methyl-5-hydroxy-6-metoxy-1,4-benzoquinol methylase